MRVGPSPSACRSRWQTTMSDGRPEIFNTDQGCQFTSAEFTGLLKGPGIQISMDGKGCWRDNVFVERLWRSVKDEEVYLKAYDSVAMPRPAWDPTSSATTPAGPISRLTARRPRRSTSPVCRPSRWRRETPGYPPCRARGPLDTPPRRASLIFARRLSKQAGPPLFLSESRDGFSRLR